MQDLSVSNISFPSFSLDQSIKYPSKPKGLLSLEFFEETFQKMKSLTKEAPRRGTAHTEAASYSSNDVIYESPAKIIIVGDANVGKTCLIKRFVQDQFDGTTSSTLGISNYTKRIQIKNSSPMYLHKPDKHIDQVLPLTNVNLNIWDTAGGERFRSLTQHFYRGAKAIIIVIDLTKRSSFISLGYWMEQIKNHADETVIKCLFCNKSDIGDKKEVTITEISLFCEKWNLNYFEGSAKNGMNVENTFYYVAAEFYNNLSYSLNKIVSLNNLESEQDYYDKNKKYNTINAVSGKEVMIMRLNSTVFNNDLDINPRKNKCGC